MSEEQTYDDTPTGIVARWGVEFSAAKKHVENWHKRGNAAVRRFKGELLSKRDDKDKARWNLFTSNVQTKQAILFGQTPTVDVGRRFGDPNDDVARVASEMLERLLNTDIETNATTEALSFEYALSDFLLPGMSFVRVRYEFDEEMSEEVEAMVGPDGVELAPAVPAVSTKTNERCVTDYVHWKDVLWSPCKVFSELRWVAFRAEMSREQLEKRFGDIGKLVPLNAKKADSTSEEKIDQPWSRADVWEVWDKERKEVCWYVEGFRELLDTKSDPLELNGFWPFPRPMVANWTTDSLLPTTDYFLAQDLYNQIDKLTQRIDLLEGAIRVAGVYDQTSEGVKRLLTETSADTNELIPVPNWAAFTEKGAIAGAISWLPIEMIIGVHDKLSATRGELVQALHQLTGMSDIMRGQRDPGSKGPVTATEQSIKARFGSVRMQRTQDEFARFVTETQQIKAEIVGKHFSPETIVERSNIMLTSDAQYAEQAVQLLQSEHGRWRVQVKPDSVALQDFAGDQNDAQAFVQGISGFLTAAAPLAQSMPGATPMLLEMLQLVMTRFKFSDEAEGIMDRAIAQARDAQAKQAGQPPPPDPKVIAAQMKAQADQQKSQLEMQKLQVEAQNDASRIKLETQAEIQKQAAQAHFDVQADAQRERIKVAGAHAMPKKPAPLPKGLPR